MDTLSRLSQARLASNEGIPLFSATCIARSSSGLPIATDSVPAWRS